MARTTATARRSTGGKNNLFYRRSSPEPPANTLPYDDFRRHRKEVLRESREVFEKAEDGEPMQVEREEEEETTEEAGQENEADGFLGDCRDVQTREIAEDRIATSRGTNPSISVEIFRAEIEPRSSGVVVSDCRTEQPVSNLSSRIKEEKRKISRLEKELDKVKAEIAKLQGNDRVREFGLSGEFTLTISDDSR
jgi:hypothetical protein